jgi:transcriptional regulator with XRE-family HTH domain
MKKVVRCTLPFGAEVWGGETATNLTDDFGELLRRHRIKAGLTQEELAERSRLSIRAIADMERGRTMRPPRGSVGRLADALTLGPPEREALERAARAVIRSGSASRLHAVASRQAGRVGADPGPGHGAATVAAGHSQRGG